MPVHVLPVPSQCTFCLFQASACFTCSMPMHVLRVPYQCMFCVFHTNACFACSIPMHVLPVPCQCMFSLIKLIANNQEIFQTHSPVASANARNKHHLHRQNTSLSCFQKKMHTLLAFQQFNTHCHSLRNDTA